MSIALNTPVEDFTALATDGDFTLSAHRGTQIVLYFYPKDNTPGCTTEGLDFALQHDAFAAANTRVFGVSRDSLKKHENFKQKQCFPFELISDPEERLCRQFDVIQLKKLYGKEYEGIVRSTFLIDATGKLVQEWRNVKVAGHVAQVLEAAQAHHTHTA